MPPKLTLEPIQHTLMVQHQGFAPVLSRAWSGLVDAAAGISSWTSADGQLLVVKVLKAEPGRVWTSCFKVSHMPAWQLAVWQRVGSCWK